MMMLHLKVNWGLFKYNGSQHYKGLLSYIVYIFAGVARAFDETVAPHPELVKICSEFYQTSDLSSPAMKLACVLTLLIDPF